MLDEEFYELLAVHEADGGGVGAFGFEAGAGAEVAGGDDEALFVGAEAAADLLDGGCLDVGFPAFDLDGHAGADDVADDQGAADVDAAVVLASGDEDVGEAQGDEELADEFFECGWVDFVEFFVEAAAHAVVVGLDVGCQAGLVPAGQADETVAQKLEAGCVAALFAAVCFLKNGGVHRRGGVFALRSDEVQIEGASGDVMDVHGFALGKDLQDAFGRVCKGDGLDGAVVFVVWSRGGDFLGFGGGFESIDIEFEMPWFCASEIGVFFAIFDIDGQSSIDGRWWRQARGGPQALLEYAAGELFVVERRTGIGQNNFGGFEDCEGFGWGRVGLKRWCMVCIETRLLVGHRITLLNCGNEFSSMIGDVDENF